MKSFRLSALLLLALIGVLVATELYFNDVLLDSNTNEITPFARICLVLITGLFLSLIVVEMTKRFIVKRVNDHQMKDIHSVRMLSIVPLVRATLIALVVVLVFLITLSEFGVDIGPMIAGAGVFGIVLGLGAQSLLKDIFAGIFYIIEDAFRIGDYVETEKLEGTVEHISLRSLRLRHPRGPLQTVPYSAFQYISNFSRDWIIVKIEFQVAHSTNILQIKKLIKTVSESFMDDENFAPFILEPLKFQGIHDVDLYGLKLRVKFKVLPGHQFVMQREVRRRMQEIMHANGIQFAKRTVAFDTPASGIAAAIDDDEIETTIKAD